jgi:hypothetical protein
MKDSNISDDPSILAEIIGFLPTLAGAIYILLPHYFLNKITSDIVITFGWVLALMSLGFLSVIIYTFYMYYKSNILSLKVTGRVETKVRVIE